MSGNEADLAVLAEHPRRFTWLGRTVVAGPRPDRLEAAVLATDLGWFLKAIRSTPGLLEHYQGFLFFDSLGPHNLSARDIDLLASLDEMAILCPVPEDAAIFDGILNSEALVSYTPPALVYFPLMLPDFEPPSPGWHPKAPGRFLMPGRVRRDFRLLVEIQHRLPAPVEVVTDLGKVSLTAEANLTLRHLMAFDALCSLASSSLGLLVLVEPGHRAGLATAALGLWLGMPVVASSVPGMQALAENRGASEAMVLVEPGNQEQVLAALDRLVQDAAWAARLAKNALNLSQSIEQDAKKAAREALSAIGA